MLQWPPDSCKSPTPPASASNQMGLWHICVWRESNKDVYIGLVKRKTLVLDLDETLIHSQHDGVIRQMVRPGTPPDFILRVSGESFDLLDDLCSHHTTVVQVTIDRHPVRFFVHKRPHVDFFLDITSQWYELVVFTASMEIYGAAVADKLDNNRGILRRRSTGSIAPWTLGVSPRTCQPSPGISAASSSWITPLEPTGPIRTMPSPSSRGSRTPYDTALLNLLPVLDALRFTSDVRSVLSSQPASSEQLVACCCW
ncbi:CTDNEP1 [Cordylochernes scorpioides]|uniref:Mitochondrial import inner membrane translocase subunit TIM50 n=1 Tax=Cordylochernes scorpioides TaxID=51811 RepID=A0ABY6KJW2_9ARAC|nr:CTDNEP1 [Cordylochernes scorpioides]